MVMMITHPSFLRVEVTLLVCAALEVLYAVLVVGCENLCLQKNEARDSAGLTRCRLLGRFHVHSAARMNG